jgi:hypothetical protein
MTQLAGLHADAQALSRQQIGAACKGSLAAYASVPFLTNTLITNADTNAGLQAAVLVTAATRHADERPLADRINLGITLGKYSTELSDSRINALTTGAGLVGLTYSNPLVITGANYPPE